MKQSVTFRCIQCKKYGEAEARPGDLICSHCATPAGKMNPGTLFDPCPICQGRQFYLSKDFPRALGCLILMTSILLVPFTYGLSLPLFALMDWGVYRRVPTLINCYQCGGLFRGFAVPEGLKSFDHHTGMKYKRFRSP